MSNIASCNLTLRNKLVYDRYFKHNKGLFSKVINNHLNQTYSPHRFDMLQQKRNRLEEEVKYLDDQLQITQKELEIEFKKMKDKGLLPHLRKKERK